MSTVESAPAIGRGGIPWRRLGDASRSYGVVAAAVVLLIVLSFSAESFLTTDNLLNILQQNAPVGIVAIGTTPLLIARGIDLSLGAAFGLAGIVAATVTNATDPAFGFFVGVCVGVGIGLGNGLLHTVLRINALIATLASGIIVAGISLLATKGFAVTVSDPGFLKLGNEKFLGVGIAIWVFAVFALVGQLVLSATTAGRRVYAAGGNPEAANLAGVRVRRVLVAVFILSGVGAAVGGLIGASQVGQASPESGGNSILFAALTAVIVGGTSIEGGEGAIWRTVVGVLFLAMINNGLNLLQVEPVYTSIVQGALILLAVTVSALAVRRPT